MQFWIAVSRGPKANHFMLKKTVLIGTRLLLLSLNRFEGSSVWVKSYSPEMLRIEFFENPSINLRQSRYQVYRGAHVQLRPSLCFRGVETLPRPT